MAGIESLGELLGIWVDHQPLISLLPGYTRDNSHLVTIMDGYEWPNGISWISCDVTSLYPSIPHDKAIHILGTFLVKHSNYPPQVKEFIRTLTDFVIIFLNFDGTIFLPKQGASMGGSFPPPLANIFMATCEETYLFLDAECLPPTSGAMVVT